MTKISESTVSRLSHYYRVLEEVAAEGGKVVSSQLLAEREGITSAQVRKATCPASVRSDGGGWATASSICVPKSA